jgi:hypothetical protein
MTQPYTFPTSLPPDLAPVPEGMVYLGINPRGSLHSLFPSEVSNQINTRQGAFWSGRQWNIASSSGLAFSDSDIHYCLSLEDPMFRILANAVARQSPFLHLPPLLTNHVYLGETCRPVNDLPEGSILYDIREKFSRQPEFQPGRLTPEASQTMALHGGDDWITPATGRTWTLNTDEDKFSANRDGVVVRHLAGLGWYFPLDELQPRPPFRMVVSGSPPSPVTAKPPPPPKLTLSPTPSDTEILNLLQTLWAKQPGGGMFLDQWIKAQGSFRESVIKHFEP